MIKLIHLYIISFLILFSPNISLAGFKFFGKDGQYITTTKEAEEIKEKKLEKNSYSNRKTIAKINGPGQKIIAIDIYPGPYTVTYDNKYKDCLNVYIKNRNNQVVDYVKYGEAGYHEHTWDIILPPGRYFLYIEGEGNWAYSLCTGESNQPRPKGYKIPTKTIPPFFLPGEGQEDLSKINAYEYKEDDLDKESNLHAKDKSLREEYLTTYGMVLGRATGCKIGTTLEFDRVKNWIANNYSGDEHTKATLDFLEIFNNNFNAQLESRTPDTCDDIKRAYGTVPWP